MARRATMIRQERDKHAAVLVLDAGGSLVGDQDPALVTRGQSSVQAMNLMGYDAATLGMLDITSLSLGELRARIAEAGFPILSANAVVLETGDLLAQPYAVLTVGDRQVGILGLTDPGTTDEVRVGDPLEAARRWLPAIQEQAAIIVLLSHAGLQTDARLVEDVDGIDVVIGGRDQGYMDPLVAPGGSLLVRADYAAPGNAGRHAGVARLSFTGEGVLAEHRWSRVALGAGFGDGP